MAACTLDGEFLGGFYFPGILLADVIAVGPNELFGLVPTPSPLYLLGTGYPQEVIGQVVRPNLVLLMFLLEFSHFTEIYFRDMGLHLLLDVFTILETVELFLQFIGVTSVLYDVILVVDHLLQNADVPDHPRLLAFPGDDWLPTRRELGGFGLGEHPTGRTEWSRGDCLFLAGRGVFGDISKGQVL